MKRSQYVSFHVNVLNGYSACSYLFPQWQDDISNIYVWHSINSWYGSVLYDIKVLWLWSWISRWRHNKPDGISYYWRLHCLHNRLFRHRTKQHQSPTSLALVRGIHQWWGSPVTIIVENISILWRHKKYQFASEKLYTPLSVLENKLVNIKTSGISRLRTSRSNYDRNTVIWFAY